MRREYVGPQVGGSLAAVWCLGGASELFALQCRRKSRGASAACHVEVRDGSGCQGNRESLDGNNSLFTLE